MYKGIKPFALLITLLIAGTFLQAQENTISPYSRFGIGELTNETFGRSRAMGGVAAGLQIPNQINILNPAATASQDTLSFIFDLGFSNSFKKLSNENESVKFKSGTLDHIAISFPITRWMKTNVGIMPYSNIHYYIVYIDEFLEDTVTYAATGNGGFNRFFISSGFKIGKNLNLGVGLNYLFGTSEHKMGASTVDLYSTNSNVYDIQRFTKLNGIYFNFGLQYRAKIKDNYLSIGVSGNPKQKINTEFKKSSIMYYNKFYTVDTVLSESNTDNISVPANINIGATFIIKNKILIGFDYHTSQWSKVDNTLSHEKGYLQNSSSLHLGAEFVPNPRSISGYFNHMMFRLGAYSGKSYIRVNETSIDDKGITAGIGFPFKNSKTIINLTYNYGVFGTTENNLIKENYNQISIGFSLYDYWFFKSKYD